MELRRVPAAFIRPNSGTLPLSQLLQCNNPNSIIRTAYTYRSISSTSPQSYTPEPTTRGPSSEVNSPPSDAKPTPSPKNDNLQDLVNGVWGSGFGQNLSTPSYPSYPRSNTSATSQILSSVSSARTAPTASTGGDIWAALKTPVKTPGSLPRGTSSSDLMDTIVNKTNTLAPKPHRKTIRLTPSTGRTVEIGANIDLPRGLRMLEMSCSQNRVRTDANKQRFHERGGLKRKREKRERWRRKFMEGFKGVIGRVKALKNQGW